MKKLGTKGVKILKMVHIFFAILWIGGGLGLTIVLFTTNPVSGDELYMKSRIVQIIDDFLIIPGAMASFFIGIIYGIWTNWGFFKHKWIVVKWILTVVQILFGTFILGPWINDNAEIASQLRDAALDNATYLHNLEMSKIWGTVQVSLLLLFIIISVLKPWTAKKEKKA